MKKSVWCLMTIFPLLFFITACTPRVESPVPKTTETPSPTLPAAPTVDTRQLTGELEEGRRLYISLGCINCHGGIGEGGVGSRLKELQRTLPEVEAQLRAPTGMMPSFGAEKITGEQIRVLYNYIRSLKDIN